MHHNNSSNDHSIEFNRIQQHLMLKIGYSNTKPLNLPEEELFEEVLQSHRIEHFEKTNKLCLPNIQEEEMSSRLENEEEVNNEEI